MAGRPRDPTKEQPRVWVRVYVDLHPDVNDELNIRAARERKSKKALIQELLTASLRSKNATHKK